MGDNGLPALCRCARTDNPASVLVARIDGIALPAGALTRAGTFHAVGARLLRDYALSTGAAAWDIQWRKRRPGRRGVLYFHIFSMGCTEFEKIWGNLHRVSEQP